MCYYQKSKSRKNTRIGLIINRAKSGSINNFYAVEPPLILGKTLSNEIFVAALFISAGLFDLDVAVVICNARK